MRRWRRACSRFDLRRGGARQGRAHTVQGYLTYEVPRTLCRGTSLMRTTRADTVQGYHTVAGWFRQGRANTAPGEAGNCPSLLVQGYLTHKKTQPPRTLP